jgi:hypothetical protein
MRLPPDLDKAGLMAPSEIAGREKIRAACQQRIRPVKGGATVVRPISTPLAPTTSRAGVFQPEELEVLQRVFDQVCRERKHHPESEEAETIAVTIIVLFQTGLLTEHDLVVAALDWGEDSNRSERARSVPRVSNG